MQKESTAKQGWLKTKNCHLSIMLVTLLASCVTTTSPPQKTGLLKPEKGYSGDLIGAEIKHIKLDPKDNITEITVLIPRDLDTIETVNVVDKDGKIIKTAKPYELSKDLDGDPNGVIIYLENSRRLPFRLHFNSEQ